MGHFCSALLLGSFPTPLPICVSAHYKQQTAALPCSSPLFLFRMQHPFSGLKIFLADILTVDKTPSGLGSELPTRQHSCCRGSVPADRKAQRFSSN